MPPILYAHPFSSYSQKVLVALYENDTPFEYRPWTRTATWTPWPNAGRCAAFRCWWTAIAR